MDALAAAAASGSVVGVAAAAPSLRAASAVRARFATPPPLTAPFDAALAEESRTLHALALHYMQELERAPAAAGPPALPALAVEAQLLRSAAARDVRDAQQGLMKA